jgi:hypothetical protein
LNHCSRSANVKLLRAVMHHLQVVRRWAGRRRGGVSWQSGLRIEALAPDGLVEAFSVQDAAAFNLCVQWHPEWQASDNPASMAVLRAFGQACQAYRSQRGHSGQVRDPET